MSRTRCGILHAAPQSRDRPSAGVCGRPRLCSAPRREEAALLRCVRGTRNSTDGQLPAAPADADAADPVRDVGADLHRAAPGARQHRRHPGRLRRHRRQRPETQDRARARPRPLAGRSVRAMDRRPAARRSRLCLYLGTPGDRGDRAAHSGDRQARNAGAVLCGGDRRAARRAQRGPAQHAAGLFPAGAQSQRAVAAVVLARAIGAAAVRPGVRLDSDLQQAGGQFLEGNRTAQHSGAGGRLPQFGADDAADAVLDAGGAAPGLHPHRALQGRVGTIGQLRSRAAQRHAAGDHHHRHRGGVPDRRADRDRDGVQYSRRRPLPGRGGALARLSDCAESGDVHRRHRRLHQFPGRHGLYAVRSPDQVRE